MEWLEPGGRWAPDDWEAAQRDVAEMMDERFGPAWRTWTQDKKVRAYEEMMASLPGQLALTEQDLTHAKERLAFTTLVHEKTEAAVARTGLSPLPRSVFDQCLTEAVDERYGGFTTLALSVCRDLGYEPLDYEPKEDRVFE